MFDQTVLETMLKDEQTRIQKDLEKFAQKLKSFGVSICQYDKSVVIKR